METSWIIKPGENILELRIEAARYELVKDELHTYLLKEYPQKTAGFKAHKILRKSLDARKRPIMIQLRIALYHTEKDIPVLQMPGLQLPKDAPSVHVVGFGPAGLFAAFKLMERGLRPIVIERGKPVKQRRRDVAVLSREGKIDPESNYCFGEGGAGTFSDGKLYTRSHKRGKISGILELLVLHGADPSILFEAHPHIGTNKLPQIIERMRETLIENGAEIRFSSKLTDLRIDKGKVHSISVNGKEEPCSALILATGHSARDIYELLDQRDVTLEAKPFAMGFRIEHPQTLINDIQYSKYKDRSVLPPASYRLVEQVEGKGVFSFCMCPGGIIAPAATEEGEVVVNGWSPSKRNGEYANSGWVTEIGPEEWKAHNDHGALAGLRFQQSIERKAMEMGGGQNKVPAQNFSDYLKGTMSDTLNPCSYHPGATSVDLNLLFPKAINQRLRGGLIQVSKKLKGFDSSRAVITAPESRTSAPVRIPRTKEMHHPDVLNLYPCGEGAGYAGGIVSAALDGENVAMALAIDILHLKGEFP